MNTTKIKTNISCGTWVQSGNSTVSEIMAHTGFDWVCADLEHSDTDWNAFANIVRSVKRHGVVPLARVSQNETLAIRKPLDLGAMGVIVPMINNADEAKKAVQAAKYPPIGIRGFAYCHANEWGQNFDKYVSSANDSIVVIAMIETREAVRNVDEILDVEGVDGVFIGPYDLSGSYGIPGKLSDPVVTDAMDQVLLACKRHGKPAGQHIVLPSRDAISRAVSQGYKLLALGMDTVFISDASRQVLHLFDQAVKAQE